MSAAAAAAIAASLAAAAAKRKADDAVAIQSGMESWSQLAKERGLGFANATGVPALEGTLSGVYCRAWIVLNENGHGLTSVAASAISEVEGHVGLVPNPGGALGFLKHHFTQDISIGDPAFDNAFLIRAKPTALALALLGPKLRAYLAPLVAHQLASFVYEAGAATLVFPVVLETAWVGLALEAAVEAARFTPPSDSPFR